VALSALDGVAAVVPFRNRGRRAGASLPHPHAQIVGLGVAPPTLRAMSAHGRARFRATGNCATCMELAAEIEDGTRVVEATGSFVALVPFAATGPFELHIAPRRHVASFGDTLPEELADFALLLGRSLRRLRAAVGDAAWRFAIESAGPGGRDAPYLHWRLRLVPELATPGGFELGTGFAVNPSLPEADAEVLRGAEPSLTTPQ
jgi:UDPglucose--hexose-1-phosphate uridylyltransferase